MCCFRARHDLARAICHGKKGELFHHYERGLENQLGVLGLVLNCVVLTPADLVTALGIRWAATRRGRSSSSGRTASSTLGSAPCRMVGVG